METENQETPEKDQEKDESTTEPPKPITHLVICGGVSYGFIFFGIIHELLRQNFLKIDRLRSIHATSAGAILAVLFALERDQEILYNYVLNRPWDELVPLNLPTFLKSVKSCGLFDQEPFQKILGPVFAANDLDITTATMATLYERTKIDVHIYVTDLDEMETVTISHKTHPEWRVLDAVYASSCIPVAFRPIRDPKTTHYLVDGGFLVNYPIGNCMQYVAAEGGEEGGRILGIQLDLFGGCGECLKTVMDGENPSLMDYMYYFINKLLYKIGKTTAASPPGGEAPLEILVKTDRFCTDVMPLLKKKEVRKEWIDVGIQHAKDYLGGIESKCSLETFAKIDSNSSCNLNT